MAGASGTTTSPTAGPSGSSGLVGRAAELARLERAAAAAASGGSTVVALVGAYGLGKTALLDVMRTGSLARGATVLATQGRAADAEQGFASLVTLLRPVGLRLDELAGDLAPELRAALALGRCRADPVAVRVATLRVLSALAADGLLLVLVDDAHLLDRATAELLAFAAGRFYADAVLIVVATEPYAATAFDDLGPDTIGLDQLDQLDDEQITRIVEAAVPLAPEPLRRCVELADGNPLVALELAASLDAGQRSGTSPIPVIPRLSDIIGSAFAERLDRLGEAARNALAMVAADDTGEMAVVVDALAGLGEPDGGLAEAEAARLVTTDGGTVRFTHPLLRPVAYHQIAAASRRVAHGVLAAALATNGVPGTDGPDAERARGEMAGSDGLRGRAGLAGVTEVPRRAARLVPRAWLEPASREPVPPAFASWPACSVTVPLRPARALSMVPAWSGRGRRAPPMFPWGLGRGLRPARPAWTVRSVRAHLPPAFASWPARALSLVRFRPARRRAPGAVGGSAACDRQMARGASDQGSARPRPAPAGASTEQPRTPEPRNR